MTQCVMTRTDAAMFMHYDRAIVPDHASSIHIHVAFSHRAMIQQAHNNDDNDAVINLLHIYIPCNMEQLVLQLDDNDDDINIDDADIICNDGTRDWLDMVALRAIIQSQMSGIWTLNASSE